MRVDIQDDGLVYDSFLGSGNLVRADVDAIPHLIEVEELFAWDLIEDRPWLSLLMQVVQSHFKWSSSDDSLNQSQPQ